MDSEALKQLVENAREDPQFFHDLVFNTESVLGKLDFLGRAEKASLIGQDPQAVIGRLIGALEGCDVTCTSSCGATCAGSCGYTTSLVGRPVELEAAIAGRFARGGPSVQGCDVTCTSSCGATCAGSCGYTTNIVARPGGFAERAW
jgi:hypothetical protein